MTKLEHHPASFGDAVRLWFRIGCLSFGGAPAQIALLHKKVVEERGWVGEADFLHALNFCMLLPGPEAHQLATYIGWRLHGLKGGLAAGVLFVLPGAIVMLGLSLVYALLGHVPFVAALFFGLKAAVLAIVVEAVHRVAKRAFKTRALAVLSAMAFLCIGIFDVPFPALILLVACIAFGIGPSFPHLFGLVPSPDHRESVPVIGLKTTIKTAVIWLLIWLAPLAFAALVLGVDHRLVEIGSFFAKLAAVTFGGAYALLAWLAQAVVENKGWLAPNEMVDGLGLAETTPGPTILVTQFVGFLAAMRAPGTLPPVIAGILGACMTVWMTFVPSFLWIFTLAPYLDLVRTSRRLSASLSAISAVVVGVIAWVAFWFALHVLFASVGEVVVYGARIPVVVPVSLRLDAALLASLAAMLLLVLHRGLAVTLLVTTGAGLILHLALPDMLGFLRG
jgi:chromate transporter